MRFKLFWIVAVMFFSVMNDATKYKVGQEHPTKTKFVQISNSNLRRVSQEPRRLDLRIFTAKGTHKYNWMDFYESIHIWFHLLPNEFLHSHCPPSLLPSLPSCCHNVTAPEQDTAASDSPHSWNCISRAQHLKDLAQLPNTGSYNCMGHDSGLPMEA